MATDLDDLNAFVAVARAQGFREAARTAGTSASRLSDTVRRLEAQLGVRLFNRTTRSVALTQAGQELLARLAPTSPWTSSRAGLPQRVCRRPSSSARLTR